MPLIVNRAYYLEVNGVKLACPAWQVTNLAVLFDDGDVRGDDHVLPYVAGRVAVRRWRDAEVKTIGLEVVGQYDIDGTVAADPARKLVQHMAYLKANLGFASTSGDGTVVAKFFRGAEATLQTNVHMLGFKGSRWSAPAYLTTTFDMLVPSGAWT